MRSYAIRLKDSTQQQRQELYDFLVAKKEPIYTNTYLTKSSYSYNYFLYDTAYKNWTDSNTTDFTVMSIPDFITKFQEPKLNIRDYCIDCTDSTYDERQQITNYLSSISESIYSHTCFERTDNDILKGVIFGYDSSGKWMTRVRKTSNILTTKEFIAKFINTGDTMSTINVGDVYLNSAGKTCTIIDVKSEIIYRHEDGKNYTISESSINKNWTKQTSSPSKARGNYKVGDRVKIRTDLISETKYGMNGKVKQTLLTTDMYKSYAGKIATITAAGTTYYHIDLDEDDYSWVDGMFEDIEPTIANLQLGMRVRVRPDLSHNKDYYMSNGKELEYVTKSMAKKAGTIVTIREISKYGKYLIKEDTEYLYWTDEMFSEIITTTEEQPITDYKIDKSKLKPKTIIICNTFEKAVAITSIIGSTISKSMYDINYSERFAIFIQSETDWEYSILEHYEEEHNWTLVEFEDVLIQSTVNFKVGDLVKLKPGIKLGDTFNNIPIISIDTATFTISKIGEGKHIGASILSNGYWYGIDALELVPKILKERTTATVTPQMLKNATATITELGLVPQTLEERITKELEEQLVAQQEPIKSIKKEESFMSKLKATAITTIDQNKEAAIIAAKMEAGRVINKQVIKQAAKHVPFWAKGYLDTPLAPVVLANAVAMLGNHTGNPKVQKVSELMLLAAADVTVQSFNLDQIIDDILAGIKLPAGILDDAE